VLWPATIFLKLLKRDIIHTVKTSSIDEVFDIVMELIEYFVLTWIVVLSFLRLTAPLIWVQKFSLYFLPALWWLGLLLYLFNSLKLKWILRKTFAFIALVLIYRRGLILLLSTFSI
jgi:hypothetical protein